MSISKSAQRGIRYLHRVCKDTPGDGFGRSHGYSFVGHCGKQEQARRIRQGYRRVLKLKDDESKKAMERLHAACANEPDALAAEVELAFTALVLSEETRVTWARAVHHLLEEFDANAREADEEGVAVDAATGLPILAAR